MLGQFSSQFAASILVFQKTIVRSDDARNRFSHGRTPPLPRRALLASGDVGRGVADGFHVALRSRAEVGLSARTCEEKGRYSNAGWLSLGELSTASYTLSFQPLDERRRDLVADEHDAQDTIVPQQLHGACPGRLNSGVASPCLRHARRRAPSHGRNQPEHRGVRDSPISCSV